MNFKAMLAVSLAANLVLTGAFVWAIKSKPTRTTSEAVAPAVETVARHAEKATEADGSSPGVAELSKGGQAFDWRLVESPDYKKYITNLRAIGCPEETIRDIIVADVNKLFESRRKELLAGGKKFEYWKAGSTFAGIMDAGRLEKQQKLMQEKRDLLKELLGVVPEEKFDMFAGMNPFESMLDFLPAEKQNRVMQLFQDLQVKMAKQFKDGTPDAEDMKGVQKAQKEMEAELAKVLSPQEFQDYQLRLSQTAMTMRMQLASFDPNEEEFQKIFGPKKKFEDEFSALAAGTEDKAAQEKRKAAKKEMDEQIKSAIGAERFAEYERAQDYAYQSIYRVTQKNNLGKEAAVQVYDMKKLAEDEARKIRTNASLSPEQRTTALQGIRAETENSIKTLLGDKAYQSYQSQSGAYWLKSISPDKKPTTP